MTQVKKGRRKKAVREIRIGAQTRRAETMSWHVTK
jgi:hypothetical protein